MPRFRIPAVSESVRAVGPLRLVSPPTPFVRRRLSRESAQGIEILGHAIEYLADEYAVDPAEKGPLGNADPRVAAIQTLKALNRAIYFSGAEVQPVWQRIRHWFLRSTMSNTGSGNISKIELPLRDLSTALRFGRDDKGERGASREKSY